MFMFWFQFYWKATVKSQNRIATICANWEILDRFSKGAYEQAETVLVDTIVETQLFQVSAKERHDSEEEVVLTIFIQ